MENRNNKFLVIITLLTIIFTVSGATLAYWNWNTEASERTNVVFSIGRNFSCEADGGGDITSTDAYLVPTTCTDSEYASANPDAKPRVIKRVVTVTPTISKDGLSINMDLWLDVNILNENLTNSKNLMYALTTNSNSCTDGVVSYGSFYEKTDKGRVNLLNKSYSRLDSDIEPETYYLYIWLDKAETNSNTMKQNFNFSLGGSCTDYDGKPEAPVLDPGMIPVTIDKDGTVNAVSEDDSNWYNYDEKKWANVVLVNKEATEGVEGSYSREDYLTKIANKEPIEVNEGDILAYYVWIPRYKYKIPYKKCSDIPVDERNMEDYPECYAPYTMSEDDKEEFTKLYLFEDDGIVMPGEDELRYNIKKVDSALQTGKFREVLLDTTSLTSAVNFWAADDISFDSLKSSEFNGNNTLVGEGNEVSIDIAFEAADAEVSYGNAKNTYYTHPAFIWDGETIPGIWVGKFETSPDPISACYTTANSNNCNNITQNPRIIPNVSSLRYQYIGNQFKTSLNFANGAMDDDGVVVFTKNENNIYGLNTDDVKTDSHMMKNSEWGAVAYLSHSKYGINSEVYINNSSNFITGRSGGNVGGSVNIMDAQFEGVDFDDDIDYYAPGYYTWLGEKIQLDGLTEDITDSTLGTNASTTGNVTGIYDMSGGAYDRVMGNYDNTSHTTYFPILPESKYYDVYFANRFDNSDFYKINLCTLDTCGGHALIETVNWYNDGAEFVKTSYPWMVRSGHYSVAGAGAGLYYSSITLANANYVDSWRSVLIVDK